MSKRKVTAGGYDMSSDGPEFDLEVPVNPDPQTKKPKTVYAPPRLTSLAVLKPGIAPFQLPHSKPPFIRASSTPGPIALSSLHSTPVTKNQPLTLDEDGPQDSEDDRQLPTEETTSKSERKGVPSQGYSIGATVSSKASEYGTGQGTDPSHIPAKSTLARSTLSLERQVNELATTFKDYKTSSDEQHRRTDEKLTRLLEAVSQLAPSGASAACAQAQSVSTSPVASEPKPYLCNPLPTPELVSTVGRVVSHARMRVGKKKGGSDDNSVKSHTRISWYRMLRIAAAKDIRPHFEDEHGEPDTLPAQFIDPETNYCQPYPHGEAPLTKQVAWVPTFILRFRSMIPNDRSELSALLRSLSDEDIIILLCDGPFKSAQTAWRAMQKTPEELEGMRSSARRYQRVERKAAIRRAYIITIPSLQGAEWEYLYNSGYMSEDESDDDEGMVTMRPSHRALWEENLYEAIRVAELEKAKAKPGLSPSPPARRIKAVERRIPQLERGTGNSKVVIRIAACGLSKGWRQKNPDHSKYAHLINCKVTIRPDISLFLAMHPMPTVSQGHHLEGRQGSRDGSPDMEDIPAFGSHAEENDVGLSDLCSGQDMTPADRLPEARADGETIGAFDSDAANDNIPIDPQLLADDSHNFGQSQREGHLCYGASNAPSSYRPPTSMQGDQPLEPGANSIASGLEDNARSSANNSRMPPPPLIDHQPNVAPKDPGASDEGPQTSGRRTSTRKAKSALSSADKVPATAQPKRRGRPPGSKNKPKPAA